MMMAMVAVMMSGGKGRAGTNEHKENGSENLLHGTNVARALLWKPAGPGSGSSKERAFPAGGARERGVNYSYDEQSGNFPSSEP